MQHIVVDGVHYLTAGTGCESNAAVVNPETIFARILSGFSGPDCPTTLQIEFIDETGRSLHTADIPAAA